MRLIVVREPEDRGQETRSNLLRYALSTAPLADVITAGGQRFACRLNEGRWARWVGRTGAADAPWAVPRSWQESPADPGRIRLYATSVDLEALVLEADHTSPWVVISNGRFATHFNGELLDQVLARTEADIVLVMAASDLRAYRERVRLTRDNELVGYRRLYADALIPTPLPADWPHHVFVRREAMERVFEAGLLSAFDVFVEKCRTERLHMQAVAVAGPVLDLACAAGLLGLCKMTLPRAGAPGPGMPSRYGRRMLARVGSEVSSQAHLIGPVLLGAHVAVEADAVVVGPSILCDNSTVQRGAVVDSSIVGGHVSVETNQVVRHGIVTAPVPARAPERASVARASGPAPESLCSAPESVFRTWPRFSYARCFKRVTDLAIAAVVLVLFAPVLPLLALAIRLNSPGPIFFRDRRQGLHGRVFDCVKFRTMSVGSDKIQEKLRFVSEVDGPQFKMTDDPRITTVGRFLRETYLDEIPQFFNVLCGHMSVVGPRPSPEAENTLCPWWRDARLSVRPGITGLWQVCRTRACGKDFQEWIHYDVRYVREFSWRLDLWICWRTLRRMVENFVSQF
jgi:lipopolysaccharide/colanic/teichoic acid biosynthesis glycosyltransferase